MIFLYLTFQHKTCVCYKIPLSTPFINIYKKSIDFNTSALRTKPRQFELELKYMCVHMRYVSKTSIENK